MPGAPKLFLREAFATLHPISFGRFKFPPPQKRSPGFNTFFPTPHLPDYPFSPRPPEAGGGNWGGKGAALRRTLFPRPAERRAISGVRFQTPLSPRPPLLPRPPICPITPFSPDPRKQTGEIGGGRGAACRKVGGPPADATPSLFFRKTEE